MDEHRPSELSIIDTAVPGWHVNLSSYRRHKNVQTSWLLTFSTLAGDFVHNCRMM